VPTTVMQGIIDMLFFLIERLQEIQRIETETVVQHPELFPQTGI